MHLMNEVVENEITLMGIELIDRKNDDRTIYLDCNWWHLNYKFLKLSIYYDPSDSLGYVGKPYYELYDGNETFRYIADEVESEEEFLRDLNNMINAHDESIAKTPENWL